MWEMLKYSESANHESSATISPPPAQSLLRGAKRRLVWTSTEGMLLWFWCCPIPTNTLQAAAGLNVPQRDKALSGVATVHSFPPVPYFLNLCAQFCQCVSCNLQGDDVGSSNRACLLAANCDAHSWTRSIAEFQILGVDSGQRPSASVAKGFLMGFKR